MFINEAHAFTSANEEEIFSYLPQRNNGGRTIENFSVIRNDANKHLSLLVIVN